MESLPEFRVLKRGENPPDAGDHILLVHRLSVDKRALVHDISGRVPPSRGFSGYAGADAFQGTPGEALRKADELACACGAPTVYVRDDTSL